MAKISIQRRFDLVPPGKDRGSEFLQVTLSEIISNGEQVHSQRGGLRYEG